MYNNIDTITLTGANPMHMITLPIIYRNPFCYVSSIASDGDKKFQVRYL